MEISKLLEESKKDNIWTIGNDTLYKLCRKHPWHKNEQEIAAKIWLIGRAYAASIERRKEHKEYINDDFYFKNVVPQIKKSKLDEFLSRLGHSASENSILEVHAYLTDLFQKITGLEKRSLASKYLHFHLTSR